MKECTIHIILLVHLFRNHARSILFNMQNSRSGTPTLKLRQLHIHLAGLPVRISSQDKFSIWALASHCTYKYIVFFSLVSLFRSRSAILSSIRSFAVRSFTVNHACLDRRICDCECSGKYLKCFTAGGWQKRLYWVRIYFILILFYFFLSLYTILSLTFIINCIQVGICLCRYI